MMLVDPRFEINLPMLIKAIDYYTKLGYRPITASQCVDKDVIDLTLPEGREAKPHIDGTYYVGSAEQSFYQLIKNYSSVGASMAPTGKFMMLTPCQRDEHPDDSHLEIFLKLELISFEAEESIVDDAKYFFRSQGLDISIVKYTSQTDIECNGIEIGSYGSREIGNTTVFYGTGLALPRISYAMSKGKSK